ncbi:transcription factor NF-E2 45 kDa subunit [Syngnathus acus]|uniref:transcription factor NF-E2 45 kDa subunit n=1 Tax=Syngnathus acus TaxID=161584 RepID=UPI001885D1F9|nr:transcription factor NF-E2 45 kDa subunit [Syngnathus acus]XP_037129888.1 transcription factor NF-E2 45 kDa subunit [Syngnathus acus]XP_037129896.1 transcription factor NF-E2 45 kDa subunit [Syngnathus acus]
MCSTANYVPPPRRTCELLAFPSSRACGGAPAHFLGGRAHGAQHSQTDMDAAWQELMAITELQGLETSADSSYQTSQYQSIEPAPPMGAYGPAPRHSAAFEVGPADAYDGGYSEGHRAEQLYEHPGPQLDQTMALAGQMGSAEAGRDDRRPNGGVPRRAMWTTRGHGSFAPSADDLESDSGLSLGSSPPLASPETSAAGLMAAYRGLDMSVACDGETGGGRAPNYQTDYQSRFDAYPGAQESYFAAQPHSSHSLFNMPNPEPAKNLTLGDLYRPESASRGSWQHAVHSKAQGAVQTAASKDERRAAALKIPFPLEKIVNLPVDDFNELLTQHTLNDAQLALIKDIRRRGKNKVAAQNCRKRKLDSIIHLERELAQLQAHRDSLVQQRLEFQHSLTYIKRHLSQLYTEVFSQLTDESGRPYSVDEYCLQQMADGETYLVPHTTLREKE